MSKIPKECPDCRSEVIERFRGRGNRTEMVRASCGTQANLYDDGWGWGERTIVCYQREIDMLTRKLEELEE